MKYGKKLLLLPPLLTLVILFFAAVKTFAQAPAGSYNVTISPIYFDLSANPGDTVSNKIRLRNNTNYPLPIKLGVEKISADLNGNITLKADTSDTTLSWINFTNPTFVAQPLEWTDIPFTINIPKNAAYGYYWTITFTQDKTSPLARSGVTLTAAAGLPVLLDVRKAGAKAEAKIQQFSVSQPVTEYLPVDFTIKIESLGNVQIQPHGSIFISDGRNKDLAVLNVNPGLGNVLPSSARIFNASWIDGFLVRQPVMQYGQPKLDKNGNPIMTLQINWNRLTSFRIGRYTANLLLVYDNGQRDVPLEATVAFWVLPYKAILVILLFLIIVFFVGRWLIKTYINREIAKRTKTA
jgi:hypothetical protein